MPAFLRRSLTAALALVLLPVAGAAAAPGDGAGDPPKVGPAERAVACRGAEGQVHRLDLTIEGTPTWGLYAPPKEPPTALVVFAHGYGHTPESWRHHLARVASEDGALAVAMDYRHSVNLPPAEPGGLPQARGWRVAEGAEDMIHVARLFDRNCPGLQTIVMYGVSMGGNASGLAMAAGATRVGSDDPLFDWWFDIEGATNVTETYQEARAVARSGNTFARNAQADIEDEMGGTFEEKPEVYLERTVVARADDVAASGVQGVVMVHGFGDGLVPYNQTREMAAALRLLEVPVEVFSVATRSDGSEPGTTVDGYAGVPGHSSPFAGHASEASTTHLVGNLGFERLSALLRDGVAPTCDREVLVDGSVPLRMGVPAAC